MARQIEHPGHAGGSSRSLDDTLLAIGFQRDNMQIAYGVRIAYWIAPPRAYRIAETFHNRTIGKKITGFSFNMSFGNGPLKPAPLPLKDSVVLLHPWGMSGIAMMPWGIHFAAAGYQVVMPDLRSQGVHPMRRRAMVRGRQATSSS